MNEAVHLRTLLHLVWNLPAGLFGGLRDKPVMQFVPVPQSLLVSWAGSEHRGRAKQL